MVSGTRFLFKRKMFPKLFHPTKGKQSLNSKGTVFRVHKMAELVFRLIYLNPESARLKTSALSGSSLPRFAAGECNLQVFFHYGFLCCCIFVGNEASLAQKQVLASAAALSRPTRPQRRVCSGNTSSYFRGASPARFVHFGHRVPSALPPINGITAITSAGQDGLLGTALGTEAGAAAKQFLLRGERKEKKR